MNLSYTPENLPETYPVDLTLIIEAETVQGIPSHDRNKILNWYRSKIAKFNTDRIAWRWFECVAVERSLRGLVAEAKMKRCGITMPHHSLEP